jgi:hypothetical protein
MTVIKFSVDVMPIEAPTLHKAQARSSEVEATTGQLHPEGPKIMNAYLKNL